MLELCLQQNPNNPQVKQALAWLKPQSPSSNSSAKLTQTTNAEPTPIKVAQPKPEHTNSPAKLTQTINAEPTQVKLAQPTPEHTNAIYTMKGVQDILEVFEDRVAITPKGILGFPNKGIKGTKEIPFQSIFAIQFKEAGAVFSGYIQFTIPGGFESRGGILAAAKDENTFMFAGTTNNAMAIEIKTYVDSAVKKLRTSQANLSTTNLSDELQKLAALKQQGLLSDEEFQAAKKRLIG